jgi:hypothetical protein
LVEGGQGSGECRAGLVVQAFKPGLKGLGARRADLRELRAAGVGDLDAHGAGIGGVARLTHQAFTFQPPHEHGHRGLRDELGRGEVRDPLRAVVAQAAQREQRAEAAPAMGGGAQQLRDARDAAVELGGEVRRKIDSSTI